MKEKYKFLVAAGGTGGHLFPAIAVVQNLEMLCRSCETKFVGTANRIESRIIPELGYELTTMPIEGFSKLLSFKTILLPLKIIKSFRICRKLIRSFKPDAVICTGAYISYPAGVACSYEKVPLILMESNVNPGKTIKTLATKASSIMTSFEDTLNYFEEIDKSKVRFIGNPVRENLLSLPNKQEAREKLGLNPELDTVLIFGGSLGALAINKASEKAVEYFKDKDIQIIWQTGNFYKTDIKENSKLRILPFIDDMATAYAAADLVVSRSGATTVAELSVCGKASVLIPLPSASNREQWNNAEVFRKKGAAVILENAETEYELYSIIDDLITDKAKLNSMEDNAKGLSKKDAGKDAAKLILELIDKKL